MDNTFQWLLDGPAYIRYRTRIDLLGQPESDPVVQADRADMVNLPEIRNLIASLQNWPGVPLSSHKSASQSFHTLNFLADIGLKVDDPGMASVCDKILATASPEGPFRLNMNIGQSHGGTGQNTGGWALCDAPNLVYALIQLGLGGDRKVKKAIDHLLDLIQDFGWPCAVSKELGNFRGPGKKNEPCPYANLAMLKVLALLPDFENHPATITGISTLLDLWRERRTRHPFIFHMGTDFCKLKAPLIWYDIVHVLDVLSHFPQTVKGPEFQDMLDIVMEKATPEGFFIPESIYLPYKEWDFGQKKQPSRWLTFLIYRINKRVEP